MHVLDTFRLDGKNALITGAGRGLGLARAQGLAQAGASLVIADIDAAAARQAAQSTAATHGVRTLGLGLDVTDAAAVKQAANSLNADFGPIDILINNAGIVYDRQGDLGPGSIPSDKVETANWDNVITTDLNAVFYCCQAFGRHMLRRGRGNIISLSSMSARVGNFGRCNNAYCAAKAGVDMLTRQLAAEWGPKGIRVNAIAPGYMNTVMGRRSLEDPAIKKFITTMTPLGRPGEPEELQGLAVFLASDASAFITGQSIVIDGGYTLW